MTASRKTETLAKATLSDPRWASVAARDAGADGAFFYSVRTTGVYCRPSCAARLALPQNVAFHASAAEAVRAGFRACLRCRPDQVSSAAQRSAWVADLCRFIEAAETPPSLAVLAARAGLSGPYLQRLFKQATGVSPRDYAAAHRAERLRQRLVQSATVTDAIYGAGYNSGRRFYAEADKRLGMTATRYRAQGADTTVRFAAGQCSLGAVVVAASERGVCAILLGDDPGVLVRELQDRFAQAELIGADAAFETLVARVVALVDAPRHGVDLPLDIRGTAFQQRVWQALCDIAPGCTASYAEIARRIGAPSSARAVAQACAANLLAVAIPCHRVVRSSGELSGYRWGVERKRALLEREVSQ